MRNAFVHVYDKMGSQVLGKDMKLLVMLVGENLFNEYYKFICWEDEYKGEYMCVGNLVLRRKKC